jgi:hypothetical protein
MGGFKDCLRAVTALRAKFNRAAYDAQIQPFASRFNRIRVYFRRHEKAGPGYRSRPFKSLLKRRLRASTAAG